jgi:hydrogenase nickel incorporation protein HypA/HybF
MHEFGIIQDILAALDKTAKEKHIKHITAVNLKIGKLRQVIPENLRFAFLTLAVGTVAAGAELNIELVPILVKCQNCHKDFEVEENVYICPHCQGTNLTILSGQDIVLESIHGDK